MPAAPSTPPESRIERELSQSRQLLERGRFADALAIAAALDSEAPGNRDVLYVLAVSQRYLGRIPDALGTLERLERQYSAYGRLYQERGHCYRAIGAMAPALEAYQRAVTFNGALPASWKAQAELLRAAGRAAEADAASRTLERIHALPVPIVTASSLFAEGDDLAAEKVVRTYLQAHPDDIEGMRLLGQIGLKLEVLDDAEFLLESVLEFAPEYRAARYDYATALWKRHKYPQALEQVARLLTDDPGNRAVRTLEASIYVGLGDHARALAIYRELLAGSPQAADVQLSIAHALKTLGRQQEAVEAYRAAAELRPGYGDAYWSLANLKTYRFPDADLARMRVAEAAPGASPDDRYHLCFALGKALEDRGDYAASFACYERGNALKKAETRYQPAVLERNLRAQMATCTAEFFAARRGWGCPRADPIFIVGLPRAGSTLLEQILASHSRVEGTMELADIPRLVQQLDGRGDVGGKGAYPAVLGELDADRARQLGERYLDDTRIFRSGKPFFVDKMPNNFRHIGLIHLALPNARIIDARREPMACCFSNFKQLFATGQEFTYSLEDIARYYRGYVEVMAHWDAVLPGRVLRVQHEDVIADLDGNVRRILEYCELEFEPACLEFYRTERSIRTASSEQVRQPIYREGMDQWRHYERWLGPLKAALGDLARA